MDDTPRMRLGTKSCAECRRRKVRCNFKGDQIVCEGCLIHNVPCRAQQPQARPKKRGGVYSRRDQSDSTDPDTLQSRLSQLEAMVQRLQTTPYSSDECLTIEGESTGTWDDEGDAPFDTAPISGLWKDAMIFEPAQIVSSPTSTPPTARHRRHSLQSLLPSSRALDIILETSEKFWPVWPSCMFGLGHPKCLIAGQTIHNRETLLEALRSKLPVLEAKALLWIMLCISHFPPARDKELSFSKPRRALMEQYLKQVVDLLSSLEHESEDINRLECYCVLWKIYFDSGKPRRAWQVLRRAITIAVQLSFHNSKSYSDIRKRIIWQSLWQNERQISGMLGLPTSVSNSHPGCRLEDLVCDDPIQAIHQRLSILCGSIIDRDQNHTKAAYATTVQLDQDLEEIRGLLPQNFWDSPSLEQPFAAIYAQQSTKLKYFTIQKHIHMPYMLKATTESKYEYSFNRAMEAARGIIDSLKDSQDIICEVMDFFVFSSAIVLMIGMLSRPGASAQIIDDDWRLFEATSAYLHRTAAVLDCSVARQGAETLDVLMAACKGNYDGQEEFVVAIPYFGKVRIDRGEVARAAASVAASATTDQSPSVSTWSCPSSTSNEISQDQTLIEFSSNEFGPPVSMDTAFENEFGMDWFNFDETAMSFDWTQEFNCDMFTGAYHTRDET
ncbi:hypothetical protein BDV96DRAFT_650564 [Lophiotrema nucula]|uniref:Zn(2)-C6 fungal-type domain-containing protein n=1 Tax=Lophiotrema nucula TaxID=690887 RepID=A0A6A5YV75_9PLEO|nr:hypothetical protein BDV96DRAFT_650564 [Lophiotrema nucula]